MSLLGEDFDWALVCGDAADALIQQPDNSISAVITDPPYGLGPVLDPERVLRSWLDETPLDAAPGFMGHAWDVVPPPSLWREVYRVLKPGGHLAAFASPRTMDLMSLSIRLAGFECRDTIAAWVYSSGQVKTGDLSKKIDKYLGAEREILGTREGTGTKAMCGGKTGFGASVPITRPATPEAALWEGWSETLKPGFEPILLFRKPLDERSTAKNCMKHGAGAMNIDASRVAAPSRTDPRGRWPTNVGFAHHPACDINCVPDCVIAQLRAQSPGSPDFFPLFRYAAKASSEERSLGLDGAVNPHPCVKPLSLMEWLVTLLTPPGGIVLDPFVGSGSTGVAAVNRGFRFLGIDREEKYTDIARQRITHATETTILSTG